MRKVKRILTVLLSVIMAMSFVACGRGTAEKKGIGHNGGKEVVISYWNSGLGTEFLDAMIKAFNEKQSEYYVTYTASASGEAVLAGFGSPDVDDVDLYMGNKLHDLKSLVSLDDVLESVADGDSKKIKEKFNANYLDYEKASDGHYYSLTWGGGAIGIVYNKALFEKAGITQLPRTTGELVTVCDKLYEAGVTPWTHFRTSTSSGGYWEYLQNLWQAQYDGMDYYLNSFQKCVGEDGKSPSKDVFLKEDGRYQVVNAMAKFITPEYVLPGSNSQDHITMQTLFLKQDIGMVVNGSWMANEMAGNGNIEEFGVMKAPVISALTDQLQTVKSDVELRKLVSAIDEVTEGGADITKYQSGENYVVDGKEISAADWERVAEARNSVGTNFPSQTFGIPTYSDAIDGAKEFLKFYYSDAGYKIFTDTLHFALPMKMSEGDINTDSWNSFEKEMHKVSSNAINYVSGTSMTKHTIFVDGGATPYGRYLFVENFCASNPSDRVTAKEAWDNITAKIEDQYDDWTANIE